MLKSWLFCRNDIPQWEAILRIVVARTWSSRMLILRAEVVRKKVAGTWSSRMVILRAGVFRK